MHGAQEAARAKFKAYAGLCQMLDQGVPSTSVLRRRRAASAAKHISASGIFQSMRPLVAVRIEAARGLAAVDLTLGHPNNESRAAESAETVLPSIRKILVESQASRTSRGLGWAS